MPRVAHETKPDGCDAVRSEIVRLGAPAASVFIAEAGPPNADSAGGGGSWGEPALVRCPAVELRATPCVLADQSYVVVVALPGTRISLGRVARSVIPASEGPPAGSGCSRELTPVEALEVFGFSLQVSQRARSLPPRTRASNFFAVQWFPPLGHRCKRLVLVDSALAEIAGIGRAFDDGARMFCVCAGAAGVFVGFRDLDALVAACAPARLVGVTESSDDACDVAVVAPAGAAVARRAALRASRAAVCVDDERCDSVAGIKGGVDASGAPPPLGSGLGPAAEAASCGAAGALDESALGSGAASRLANDASVVVRTDCARDESEYSVPRVGVTGVFSTLKNVGSLVEPLATAGDDRCARVRRM